MIRSILVLLLLAAPAHAADAYYETYAAGVPVAGIDARFELGPERYRLTLEFRTLGALNLLVRSRQRSTVEGRFVGGSAAPERFFSTGTLRGEPRATQIDYPEGQPVIRQLIPPNKAERELVPPERQANTIDTLSASAALMRRIALTGRCDGRAITFDGRRLAALDARTTGTQTLEPTGRSTFAGPAMRCDFTGRQIGGFMLDEDRATLERPQQGTAWFAAVDGTVIPVRVAFKTRWVGDATAYLTDRPR